MAMQIDPIVRPKNAREILGGVSLSTLDRHEHAGLLTPRVSGGPGVVGWPQSELSAILDARKRGASDDDVRRLVRDLVAARADDSEAAA